ncbi:MAG: ATP-dependent sacrificial sulfur transferase LarE [Chlamydiota bacterium]|nr:ATP-dependent sacrificial sulfur transferase LarE [Chlamydiota bacterium]
MIDNKTINKLTKLKDIIGSYPNLLVAYSGGLDSTFLLKIAHEVLQNRVMGIMALSPSLPGSEEIEAETIANELQIPIQKINTREMDNPEYIRNSSERCYFCKSELFDKIKNYADLNGYQCIAYGAIKDDEQDIRPGMRAANQYKIKKPLLEAGLYKEEIRLFARELNLPNWNKPQQACLSSRIPFGHDVTEEKLKLIEKAEDYMHSIGFKQVRVRCFPEYARIEVPKEQLFLLSENRTKGQVTQKMFELGFKDVLIDPEGYRQGKLHIVEQN